MEWSTTFLHQSSMITLLFLLNKIHHDHDHSQQALFISNNWYKNYLDLVFIAYAIMYWKLSFTIHTLTHSRAFAHLSILWNWCIARNGYLWASYATSRRILAAESCIEQHPLHIDLNPHAFIHWREDSVKNTHMNSVGAGKKKYGNESSKGATTTKKIII